MDMYAITAEHPLLGILRNVPLEKTIDYADAAVRGGVAFFEVALNSPHALEQITMLRKHFGDRCLVGGGTAITTERCRTAVDAGAQFLLTPTDVAVSLEYGFKTMKLFPAGSMPMNYLKDLKGPFDDTHYMAIGGVNPQNIRQFFDAGYLSVGLASSLMPKDAVAANDWETCEAYVRDLVSRIGRN